MQGYYEFRVDLATDNAAFDGDGCGPETPCPRKSRQDCS